MAVQPRERGGNRTASAAGGRTRGQGPRGGWGEERQPGQRCVSSRPRCWVVVLLNESSMPSDTTRGQVRAGRRRDRSPRCTRWTRDAARSARGVAAPASAPPARRRPSSGPPLVRQHVPGCAHGRVIAHTRPLCSEALATDCVADLLARPAQRPPALPPTLRYTHGAARWAARPQHRHARRRARGGHLRRLCERRRVLCLGAEQWPRCARRRACAPAQ